MLTLQAMNVCVKYKATVFAVFFMAIIVTPSIIKCINTSVDIACFFDVNEEESEKNIKLFVKEIPVNLASNLKQETQRQPNYHHQFTYKKPILTLIYPPPETL